VIGVGVKNSTSDLFLKNCDEFHYYDDLIGSERSRRPSRATSQSGTTGTGRERQRASDKDKNAPPPPDPTPGFELVTSTLDDLVEERKEGDRIWASMIKEAIKRRDPSFTERAYGFRSFNALLLEAQARGHLKLEADAKSGSYTVQPID
jgi:hypothetical protein